MSPSPTSSHGFCSPGRASGSAFSSGFSRLRTITLGRAGAGEGGFLEQERLVTHRTIASTTGSTEPPRPPYAPRRARSASLRSGQPQKRRLKHARGWESIQGWGGAWVRLLGLPKHRAPRNTDAAERGAGGAELPGRVGQHRGHHVLPWLCTYLCSAPSSASAAPSGSGFLVSSSSSGKASSAW